MTSKSRFLSTWYIWPKNEQVGFNPRRGWLAICLFAPRVGGLEGPDEGGKKGRKERIFGEFMTRYFMNRNRTPWQRVPPFWLSAPSLHNRHLSSPDLYRDQAPVVKVQLRFRELYYSGSALEQMRNEIVYSVPIPGGVSNNRDPAPR